MHSLKPRNPSLPPNVPAGHSKHADWPLTFMKLPAAHGKQMPLPVSGWTVPGLHLVCSVLPAGEKWLASVPERERVQSSI